MSFLDRNLLLTPQKLKIEKVDLDNGDWVFIRQMTGHERDQLEQSLRQETVDKKGETTYKSDLRDYRAKLAVCVLCDEQGALLMEPGDYARLSKSMIAPRLEFIADAAGKLNAINESAKGLAIKNSEADPVGSSISE